MKSGPPDAAELKKQVDELIAWHSRFPMSDKLLDAAGYTEIPETATRWFILLLNGAHTEVVFFSGTLSQVRAEAETEMWKGGWPRAVVVPRRPTLTLARRIVEITEEEEEG